MLVSWGKSFCSFFMWMRTILHEFSEQFTSHEYKESVHISWPILPIFHQWINLKKFILARKHIEGSNNDYTSIIKISRKTWDHWADQLQECKNTALVWFVSWDLGWENMSKVSRPFHLSSFDYYFIIHIFDPYLIFVLFMVQASWNSWNLLSLVDHETTQGKQPRKLQVLGCLPKNSNTRLEVGNFTTFLPAPRGRGAGSLRSISNGH